MKIRIRQAFHADTASRDAGGRLRLQIAEAIRKNRKVELDFAGCMIASTSFFDEGIAKLADENLSLHQTQELLVLSNLHTRDAELLSELCTRRGLTLKI